jgi:uncharacterized protein (DUF885 family)
MRKLGYVALILLVLVGCGSKRSETPRDETQGLTAEVTVVVGESPQVADSEALSLDEFFEVSWRELALRDPENVLADGMADVCGLEGVELTNISDEYLRETYALYASTLETLRTYDRSELTPEQQVSYDVYEWYLEDRLREQEFMYYDYPATFYPITATHWEIVHFFTDLHPVASKQDAEDYVTRLEQVDTKFEQLLDGLKLREEAGIVPPKFSIQWGLYSVRNLAKANATRTPFYEVFRDKVNALEDVSDAEKQDLLKSAEQAIKKSVLPGYKDLAEYMKHLESVAPTDEGVWQFDGGDAYYEYVLRHFTTTDMTADEVHEVGKKELARIHDEMRTIFDELGYPDRESLPQLFDRVEQDGGFVPGSQVMETYEAIIDEADKNLDVAFDIRPEADVVVLESSIKGMYVSASRDGSRPGAFHAGLGNADEPRYAMPTLAYHEAVPGHHTQIALAQESDLPEFRNSIGYSGFAEGWALYAEKLASELGWYDDDPYGDLGRLQAEAFRAARLVVDTGIHAKRWTFDEAVDFFVENTGYEPGDAVDPEGQIARYIVWPGQSTSYKVGMIKIMELRQRAVDELGDEFDIKEFHNVVLSNGSVPLEILERIVDDYIEEKRQ